MRQFGKLVVLELLRGYKWAISPMFPPACRYVPSCSEYAMEAVERYGALRGGGMALWRLVRCHPFASGGYDPVVRQSENPHFLQRTREMGHPAQAAVPLGLKPECFQVLDGAAASRALAKQEPHPKPQPQRVSHETPNFSERAREMGDPPHERVTAHEQLPTSPAPLQGAI
jgi:putative membrane protein insertion efficiency factor